MNLPTQGSPTPGDFQKEIRNLREKHSIEVARKTVNALLLGSFGSGKTYFLGTCPKPVLIHSFDPGGYKSLMPLIDKGEVIVDSSFEVDNVKNPTVWDKWEKTFHSYRTPNKDTGKCIFDGIGTYAIDSYTTFISALVNKIAAVKGRTDQCLTQPDWQIVTNIIKDAAKLVTSIPCHTVMIGHLSMERDDVEGRMLAQIAATPKLRGFLPLLFDEVWVALSETGAKGGPEYKLLTAHWSRYEARTRIGGPQQGKFLLKEEPNFKHLLRKAGYPCEDKELFLT